LKHFKTDFVIIVLPEIPRFYAIDEKGAMIEKLFQFIFVIHAEYVSVNLGYKADKSQQTKRSLLKLGYLQNPQKMLK
jgi:hypothetical protein